ncbi:MAG: ATP-binding cassette domain-containing protein [Phycisphaeraceae bacterium]|nr:ATP-binding cassette domain-containing protein [Phycisphaeraceae bacterium]
MISLKNLTKRFEPDADPVVEDLSLEIEDGQILVLLGSSGCGKTTTLKMINRLIDPTSGQVQVDGRNAAEQSLMELRRSIGYVFQNIGLFPHMSVVENAAIVPRLLGWDRTRRLDRARELLDLVGLDPDTYADRRPDQLSGGQQQRIGMARALAADPKHLLMDEPFGALDAIMRDQLQQEVLKIQKDLNKTIVFVTHDLFEALRLGDRIAVMNSGRIDQADVPAKLLEEPATDHVRNLFDQARRQVDLLDRRSEA